MELEDLKKSWKTMDEKLKNKQLVNDDDLLKMIQSKKSNAQKSQKTILKSSILILIITVILIGYFVATAKGHRLVLGESAFWIIIGLAAVALPWSIYTIRYLQRTNIFTMPLATVIERVNRYNYWMVIERILGAIILFVMALLSIIHLQIWEYNGWFPYLICGIWVLAFVFYFLLINKITFRRLKKIRKNLDELKEVDNSL